MAAGPRSPHESQMGERATIRRNGR